MKKTLVFEADIGRIFPEKKIDI